MKWKRKDPKKKDPKRWKTKFAWLPVRIEEIYIWLETYQERWIGSEWVDFLGCSRSTYERRKDDILVIVTRYEYG